MPRTRSRTQQEIVAEEGGSYEYTPTERHIFDPSTYKDELLPLWRFKTPDLARNSAIAIWTRFEDYGEQDDFVGMDNARKFLQMGMTRAARYANHTGGRKYGITADGSKKPLNQPALTSLQEEQMRLKRQASDIFREYWQNAKKHPKYQALKEAFLQRQKH